MNQDFVTRIRAGPFGREQAFDHAESFWRRWGNSMLDGKTRLPGRKPRDAVDAIGFEIRRKTPDAALGRTT